MAISKDVKLKYKVAHAFKQCTYFIAESIWKAITFNGILTRISDLNKVITDLAPGKKYTEKAIYKITKRFGAPKTLGLTNNIQYFAYFKKGDFTLVVDKHTNKITHIIKGRLE